jgi:hypothetical protein
MPTMKHSTTRAAFSSPPPTHKPYRNGDIPAAWHTFYDFDIPRTYALVSPVNEYGMRFARVYTPNPWVRTEIRYYDWVLGKEGVWYRSKGSSCVIETARLDYTNTKAQGWTPQDVIANPLNGSLYAGTTWDEWSCHFSGMTQQFYRIIPVYNNTYPRKGIANA